MKRLFICVVGLVIAVTAWSRTFNMKELGADPRGIESCTELINQTIEKASSEGGGTIYFPAGVYLTATIHMKSNITLYVESGAVLRFSDRFEDYLPFVKIRWEGTVMNTLSPLIYAHDAENLTITGRGTLNGNGFKWWSWEKETRELIKKNGGKLPALNKLQRMWEEANEDLEISDYYKPSLERRMFRPPFIQFYECNNVLIENVKIVNSPFWTINPAFCDNVTVHGVTIYNPSKDPKGPNTDGINPSSCRNVRISDCFISVGDDCITIKSGRDADGRKYGKACENITITNCVMLSGHGGVVIGSEMSGGVENIYMDNIQIGTVKNALYFKSNRDRGGYIRNIQVSNITIERSKGAVLRFETNYFGFRGGRHTSQYENFRINNVKAGCSDHYAIFIDGYEEKPIKNIEIEHFHVQKAPHPYYLRCVENICLKATFVNGQNLPEYPKKQKERVILDVY